MATQRQSGQSGRLAPTLGPKKNVRLLNPAAPQMMLASNEPLQQRKLAGWILSFLRLRLTVFGWSSDFLNER
jgi:hypothetical protein